MKCRCLGFLLLSGGIVATIAGCGGREAEATAKVATTPKAVTVTVAPLEHRAVIRTVDVVGTLHGWEEVTIGAKREGRVLKVLHDMGDRVAPGELLVELENQDSDLAVQQAEHQLMAELAKLGLKDLPTEEFDVATVPAVVQAEVMLTKAKQNLNRERSLMQRNASTMQDYQNAENDVRGYEAALANAILTARSTLVGAQAMKVMLAVSRYRRSEMEIHAPVPTVAPEGITGGLNYAIAKRRVAEGQMLKQGDAVVELVIENPLRLQVNVPQHHTDDVKTGQAVGLVVAAHPGTTFEGKVVRINPRIDDASRTFQVEVLVPNNRGLLRPGGSAKAAIVISEKSRAATVPIGSDFTFAGVTKIFIVEGDHAHAIPVKTGLQGNGWIEVIGDLPDAAQVVTTGQVHLAEGTPVAIRSAAPVPAAPEKEPKPVAQAEERSQR
jgi:multidrug efflux pump subunit AcrA (membrane-fusion protein)